MKNTVKEPAPKYNFISPKEYLEMERASDEKHEYFDGHIYLMSGASLKHAKVAMNLAVEIGSYLKEEKCKVLAETMRVATKTKDAYMYPDLLIYCDKEELEDDKFDTMLNPSVIFEILSPSTRSIDKGRKMMYYKEIPSLKEVEKEYHGKNIEFVSISVDVAKDHEKWQKFVTEKLSLLY